MRYLAIIAGFALAAMGLLALGAAQAAETVMSDGKCFVNTSNGNWEWAGCPHQGGHKARHHK